ncbi:AAA family ATPase [Acidovorax sp. Leaf78]|uniref:AAA family ATPase n=1 Tax=Acidovorax sp. Leaf78 TaxID=1736237 RepID=UPI00138F8E6E|nr:AAA family ATPase [Acidovorax sp. Leaf78]
MDEPALHLSYLDSGRVVARTVRGEYTINEFSLNREDLVGARKRQIAVARRSLQIFRNAYGANQTSGLNKSDLDIPSLTTAASKLQELLHDDMAYAGAMRQVAFRSSKRLAKEIGDMSWLGAGWYGSLAAAQRTDHASDEPETIREHVEEYRLDSAEGRRRYKLRRRLLQSIEITNLRGIRSLSLSVSSGTDSVTPWLTLLGENGVGKSTVLQATAIALAGPRYFQRLHEAKLIDVKALIRHRCLTGEVSVRMSGFDAPYRVRFTKTRVEFFGPLGERSHLSISSRAANIVGKVYEAPTVVLGYGAIRLPARTVGSGTYGTSYARIENLFSYEATLVDPRRSLQRMSKQRFEHAAKVIRELLSLRRGASLLVKKEDVVIREHGTDTSLAHLSDGYQGVISLVVDVLEAIYKVWPNVADAEGVVLIDEIGTHLHPGWKMRIVEGLKSGLPGIQFITSTHDPLCLRGLNDGEVAVLRRDAEGQIAALRKLPSPAGYRVDQLLTSDFFGLRSTVDPLMEQAFERYYELLALAKPNARERVELAEVKATLDANRHLGETPRDRMMYAAIDRLIALEEANSPIDSPQLTNQAIAEISQRWNLQFQR